MRTISTVHHHNLHIFNRRHLYIVHISTNKFFSFVLHSSNPKSAKHFFIMPKSAKSKCYQSANDTRSPKCRVEPFSLCTSCELAMSRYTRVKAEKLVKRIFSRRQASKMSRLKQTERFSDLCSDNIALKKEWLEQSQVLNDINIHNQTFASNIMIKANELSVLQANTAANLAILLSQVTLGHLDQLQREITTILSSTNSWELPSDNCSD